MFSKAQVIQAIRWALLGRLLAQVITWSVSLIVLRYVSPESYGSYIVVQLMISFCMMVNVFGFDKLIIQTKNLSKSQAKNILFIMACLSILFVALINLTSPIISEFYNYDGLQDKIFYLSFALLLTPWLSLAEAYLDKELRFKEKAKCNLAVALACSVITIILILNEFGIWALVASFLVQRVSLCICYCVIAQTPLLPSVNFSNFSKLGFTSGLFLLGDVLWFLTQSVDGLLGASWYSMQVYGFYALAIHLSSLILNKMMPIFNQTMMAFIAKIQDQKDKVLMSLRKVLGLSLYVSIPIFWGLATVAEPLVLAVFGPKWQQSAIIISVLCAIIPLKINNSIVSMTLLGMGEAKLLMLIRLLVLISLSAALFGFKQFSELGLVYAVAVSIFIHALVNIIVVYKIFGQFIGFSFKPILFGVLMVSSCLLLSSFLNSLTLPLIINLIIEITIGVLCYVILMYALASDVTTEIKTWFKGETSLKLT
ncbi:oligosaccharide flippase family protein [Glaciecola sp. 2405UD65-10]|uniref:oligosaccharide flippase family protein n=1 Tax=Glaciecola sp. 2405UD65-10 TaxID=3397244 RepID=UPI003B58BA31